MQTLRKRARIWALILVFAGGVGPPADAVAGQEIRGSVFVETRVFPNDPLFAEQSDAVFSPSIGLAPELIWWTDGDGPELRLSPMLRLDAHDASRRHVDVREASALWLRDGWTLMAGVGKVFWGTTESVHLVDIVNQTDGVEDIDGEDKLGQPMVNLTLERDWGALDLFVLPFFRERTFPGSEGRLRGLASVLDDAVYESDAGRWRPDFAARWSHSLGSVDLGVAGFYGTSREPYLLPIEVEDTVALQPYYTIIDQSSVDAQYCFSFVPAPGFGAWPRSSSDSRRRACPCRTPSPARLPAVGSKPVDAPARFALELSHPQQNGPG